MWPFLIRAAKLFIMKETIQSTMEPKEEGEPLRPLRGTSPDRGGNIGSPIRGAVGVAD